MDRDKCDTDTLVVGVALLEWLKDDKIPMCFDDDEPPADEDRKDD